MSFVSLAALIPDLVRYSNDITMPCQTSRKKIKKCGGDEEEGEGRWRGRRERKGKTCKLRDQRERSPTH